MSWHCITLENTADAESASIVLIDTFEQAFAQAGKPPGVDVFRRRRGDGSVVFYLSPAASALFAEFLPIARAVECAEPSVDDKRVRVRL